MCIEKKQSTENHSINIKYKSSIKNKSVPATIFLAAPVNNLKSSDESISLPLYNDKKNNLKMTKSASESVKRFGLKEQSVRDVLESASEVMPDRDNPDRTRFTLGKITVLTARDGVILGVFLR